MNTGHSAGSMISSNSEIRKDKHQATSASRSCPSCGSHELECNVKNLDGFPAGLRFDPSDEELILHLESMVKDGGSGAHPLINHFIRTIQGDDGICYTHPENLPGVTRDGLSKHFFHISSKAYLTGTRKRRKIMSERGQRSSEDVSEARWHKTGKTRPLFVRGQQKGFKKILVLYVYRKQAKFQKANWIMHQYHLGMNEEEKDGELVLSKVFYQNPAHSATTMVEKNDEKVEGTSEVTPNTLPVTCEAAVTSAAAVTMVQQQQDQQLRYDHGHGLFVPAKMDQEVGVGDPISGDQEQVHGNHHIPSQHQVQSVHKEPDTTLSLASGAALNTESTNVSPAMQQHHVQSVDPEPDTTLSLAFGTSLNTESTKSPAVPHASPLLNSGFHSQSILLQDEKEQQQKQQQRDDCIRSCSLGEAMIASHTSSTEEDDASTQPKEI